MRKVKLNGKRYVLVPLKKYEKIVAYIKSAKRKMYLAAKKIKRLKGIIEEQNEMVSETGGLRIMVKRQNKALVKRDLLLDSYRTKLGKLKEKEKRMRRFLEKIYNSLIRFGGLTTLWQSDKKALERILAYEPKPKRMEIIVRDIKKRKKGKRR